MPAAIVTHIEMVDICPYKNEIWLSFVAIILSCISFTVSEGAISRG
ncbi:MULTISPECIES: hypothetical protein [Bacillus cereus group]|nr:MULTISPECIES: hypothetical protein [Bacillus cereus group]EEL73825.1 hypothetical protein bcere0027_48400 [Bacillus cereus AH676]MCU5451588.1 hypothetical protein [Bacillus cereus]MDF9456833.1 hypothetical protein [Bacillus cereus]MEB9881477.1 hypothetical protein [Bacillus cereus]HDR6263759.1 hypothetical protein [Bacillus cereus]